MNEQGDVGWSEKATMSADWPLRTLCAWSPEAPYDWLKETSLPAGVDWNDGMIFPYASFGVE